MTSIPTLPANASREELREVLESVGCVVVTGAMPRDVLEGLRADLDEHLRGEDPDALASLNLRVPQYSDPLFSARTKRMNGLIRKSTAFRHLVTHPVMLAACDETLKPNCATYHVHLTVAFAVGPGAVNQALHREEDTFGFDTSHLPNLVLSSMWAVTDFTEANGGTRMVPGSHLWPAERVAREDEIVAAEMPAGSVLLWMGRLLHGAGANRTNDDWRFGAFLSYSLGWLRQEENQYTNVPWKLAKTFPKELRDLVGYKMNDGLGYMELDA